jgi:hypothetical protein
VSVRLRDGTVGDDRPPQIWNIYWARMLPVQFLGAVEAAGRDAVIKKFDIKDPKQVFAYRLGS